MFSNSIHRIKISANSTNLIIVLTLGAIVLTTFSSLSISLPDKIGRLNDYGNILTMEDQRELQKKINQLKDRGIGLTLLITTRDPYLNPDIYASKIRAKWDLTGKYHESFLLFVREGDSWAVRTFFSGTLLNLFSADDLKNYQETLRQRGDSGKIRTGTLYAVNTIYRKAFPPKKENSEQPSDQGGLPLFIIIGGAAGGIILLILLIRWEAMRRCPRCGSRLNISRARNEFTGETTKNCPECGYSETG